MIWVPVIGAMADAVENAVQLSMLFHGAADDTFLSVNAIANLKQLAENVGSKDAFRNVYIEEVLAAKPGSEKLAWIYDLYKAHRPEAPEDLRPQFGLIREATRAFNVACVEQRGWEADDLIATYATLARRAGADVTIVASDKDLMQLIEPGVVMLDTMKDKRIEAPEVFEKFGVTPDKVVDVQALAGDPVDNVPGVPGIGIKTAAQLITEYGDVETLLGRGAERIPRGQRLLRGDFGRCRRTAG